MMRKDLLSYNLRMNLLISPLPVSSEEGGVTIPNECHPRQSTSPHQILCYLQIEAGFDPWEAALYGRASWKDGHEFDRLRLKVRLEA